MYIAQAANIVKRVNETVTAKIIYGAIFHLNESGVSALVQTEINVRWSRRIPAPRESI